MHALPGRRLSVADGLEGEAAGDIDQRIELAEMVGHGIDGLLGLRGVRQIDAADFEVVLSRCRYWRSCVIHAGELRARGNRTLHPYSAERALHAHHHDRVHVHVAPSATSRGPAVSPEEIY